MIDKDFDIALQNLLKIDLVVSISCPFCNYHQGLFYLNDIGTGKHFKCRRNGHFGECNNEFSYAPTIERYNEIQEGIKTLEEIKVLCIKARKLLPTYDKKESTNGK